MPQFYVYVYRDPSRKNEPIYCGKGQDRRAYEHLTRTDKHEFVHRLAKMKRNGVEPIINVVDMPSEELALQCEIDTIARFGRKDLGKGPLLNMTDGGDGTSGRITIDETREKMSLTRKGQSQTLEHIDNRRKAMIGQKRTDETREKMSKAHQGRTQPIVICPHCGFVGAKSRWHFDNCKYKK